MVKNVIFGAVKNLFDYNFFTNIANEKCIKKSRDMTLKAKEEA